MLGRNVTEPRTYRGEVDVARRRGGTGPRGEVRGLLAVCCFLPVAGAVSTCTVRVDGLETPQTEAGDSAVHLACFAFSGTTAVGLLGSLSDSCLAVQFCLYSLFSTWTKTSLPTPRLANLSSPGIGLASCHPSKGPLQTGEQLGPKVASSSRC